MRWSGSAAVEERKLGSRKTLLKVAAGLLVVGAVARRAARGCGPIDFERMIDRMPENAPPKWMFRNISAIRANTEHILELLDAEHAPEHDGRTATLA